MLKTLLTGTGNYSRKERRDADGYCHEEYRYFGNLICEVNHRDRTFRLDACGHNGYRSTTRALNDLERRYGDILGYTLIERK